MNQDGIGFNGSGLSDMRQGGTDLQHAKQNSGREQNTMPGCGGPMKEALETEMSRHKDSKAMRVKHLQEHYTR